MYESVACGDLILREEKSFRMERCAYVIDRPTFQFLEMSNCADVIGDLRPNDLRR
jgi:hypothetical protein